MPFGLKVQVETPSSTSSLSELWQQHTGFPLTATQARHVEAVTDLIPEAGKAVLKGPAGTGKTTVTVAAVVEAVRCGYSVVVAAPTHKAAKVLDKQLQHWGMWLGLKLPEPRTIHSVLGLEPKRVPPGQPEGFYQKRTPDLRGAHLLLVDECSMVGAELHRYVLEAVANFEVALLYAGDECQLRPVNEIGTSQSFRTGTVLELTEVLRHDGAVLKLATRARKVKHPQVLPDVSGGSAVVTYPVLRELEKKWLEEVAVTARHSSNDELVMLCWTNFNRRKYNDMARKRIYGPKVPEFMVGDRLLTLKPAMQNGEIIVGNNAEVTVQATVELEAYKPVPSLHYAYECWQLKLGCGNVIYVLKRDNEAFFNKNVASLGKDIKLAIEQAKNELANCAKASDIPLKEKRLEIAKNRWRTEYFPLKEAFASVDFGYALTIHKSQGSTYDRVFVCNDYEKSGSDRQQLLYVAVTRAAKEVHHVHVGLG